jgi:hypothetical protein
MDARAERRVFDKFRELAAFSQLPEQRDAEAESAHPTTRPHKGRITVFITHRMASTRIADRR